MYLWRYDQKQCVNIYYFLDMWCLQRFCPQTGNRPSFWDQWRPVWWQERSNDVCEVEWHNISEHRRGGALFYLFSCSQPLGGNVLASLLVFILYTSLMSCCWPISIHKSKHHPYCKATRWLCRTDSPHFAFAKVCKMWTVHFSLQNVKFLQRFIFCSAKIKQHNY